MKKKRKGLGPPAGLPSGRGIAGVSPFEDPGDPGNPAIRAEKGYFSARMCSGFMFDSSEHSRFVQNVERHVRQSKEYKQYIRYMAETLGLDKCSFFGNITSAKADLEMHHHPFTLYDIVCLVMAEAVEKGEKYTTFSVAKDVLGLHYSNMVGVVMLSVTVHELVHAGAVQVGPAQVFGNLQRFMDRFFPLMTSEIAEKWNTFLDMPDAGSDILGMLTIDKKRIIK